jgi:hypothetical protein
MIIQIHKSRWIETRNILYFDYSVYNDELEIHMIDETITIGGDVEDIKKLISKLIKASK